MAPDDSHEQARHQLGQALMQTRDLLAPVLDSAEGIKADMIGRGWNPHNAETVAVAYVQVTLQKVLGVVL